jgi:hypothetical protein
MVGRGGSGQDRKTAWIPASLEGKSILRQLRKVLASIKKIYIKTLRPVFFNIKCWPARMASGESHRLAKIEGRTPVCSSIKQNSSRNQRPKKWKRCEFSLRMSVLLRDAV